MRIIIIGAGLGGLTLGALAARDGHGVTIYDRNSVPGGVLALAEQDGYKWEQGPLILGDMLPGDPVFQLLAGLGIRLPTVRADRGIVMPDYEMCKPQQYQGPYWRREKLKKLFPEEKEHIDAYYRFYEDVIRLRHLSTLPRNPVNKLRTALAYAKIKKYADMNADQLTRHFFENERIRALFTGIFADFCADPSEAAGLGTVFCNLETAFDKRIPLELHGKPYRPGYVNIVGGCQKIAEALVQAVSARGGRFRLDTVVEKVLIENGRAVGVRLSDGTQERADAVVGSGGAKDFFGKAVGLEHLNDAYREVLDTFMPMEAVFMVHLGVDFDPLKYMSSPLCYYYGTYDLHEATQRLRSGVYHEGKDGFLIYVPSAHAPAFAPAGKHCVTIYTVAPDTLKEGTWADKKEEYAAQLIALAEQYLPELSKHITCKKIVTAEDYRVLTHMEKCSFGGLVPKMGLKNPSHVTPVEGLYFVGQQSENCGGVGAVMLGSRDAYLALKEREAKERFAPR